MNQMTRQSVVNAIYAKLRGRNRVSPSDGVSSLRALQMLHTIGVTVAESTTAAQKYGDLPADVNITKVKGV